MNSCQSLYVFMNSTHIKDANFCISITLESISSKVSLQYNTTNYQNFRKGSRSRYLINIWFTYCLLIASNSEWLLCTCIVDFISIQENFKNEGYNVDDSIGLYDVHLGSGWIRIHLWIRLGIRYVLLWLKFISIFFDFKKRGWFRNN